MPDYSIIIPAYNEENYLPATLKSIKAAMKSIPDFTGEIIVVNNNSSDRTEASARENGADKVVFEAVNMISRARNSGADAAESEYLIFIDADTIILPELLVETVKRLKSGSICGGGAAIGFDRKLDRISQAVSALWNNMAPRMNMAAGSYIYCLKKAFDELGGFNPEVYAAEELGFSLRLARWGKPRGLYFTTIKEFPVRTSLRKTDWYSPLKMLLNAMTILLLFPFAVRSKKICAHWYCRPGKK